MSPGRTGNPPVTAGARVTTGPQDSRQAEALRGGAGTVTHMYAGPGMAAWRRHGRASAYLNRCVDLLRVSSALCTATAGTARRG